MKVSKLELQDTKQLSVFSLVVIDAAIAVTDGEIDSFLRLSIQNVKSFDL